MNNIRLFSYREMVRQPKILLFQDNLFFAGPILLKELHVLCINAGIPVGVKDIGTSGFPVAIEVLSFIDPKRIRRSFKYGRELVELISRPECDFSLIRNLKTEITESDYTALCLSAMGLRVSPLDCDTTKFIVKDVIDSVSQTFRVHKFVNKSMKVMYRTGNFQ